MPLDPAQVAEGPLGIEATHHWEQGGVVLNEPRGTWPRYKVDHIGGLHSLSDADNVTANRTSQVGEVGYPGYARGKTITYEGSTYAQTLAQLRTAVTALRAAFSNRGAAQRMLIIPDPGYSTYQWQFNARVMQLDTDDRQAVGPAQVPTPYQRDFTLGLRMFDPRYYLYNFDGADATVTTMVNGNGWTETVVNHGNAPTDPWFNITVNSGAEVTLHNNSVATSNGNARLRLILPDDFPDGSTLWIDFRSRQARIAARTPADVVAFWDSQYSQWWDELIPGLQPGNNDLMVDGTGVLDWQASFRHASW